MIIVLQYRPTIVNYDFTVITIINYDRKTFIVQATGVFGTSIHILYFNGKAWSHYFRWILVRELHLGRIFIVISIFE